MLFSIIVPVYNSIKYLEKCLDSIMCQTYSNFEVIIVDDGSTDGSSAVCDRYSLLDSRIKVFHKKNGGVVSARKEGIKNASGNYIVSVDSDDYISCDLLRVLYDSICEFNCDVVLYDAIAFNRSKQFRMGNFIDEGYYEKNMSAIRSEFMFDSTKGKLNFGNMLFSLWSKAIRKDLMYTYQMLVPNDVVKGDDLAVVLPVIKNCKSMRVISGNYYYYRISDTSIMHDFSPNILDSNIILWEYLATFCDSKDDFIKLSACIINMLWEYCAGILDGRLPFFKYVNAIESIYNEPIMDLVYNFNYNDLSIADKVKIDFLKKPNLFYYYIICLKKKFEEKKDE